MRKEERTKADIMNIVDNVSVPQMRVLYAFAYAKVYGTKKTPLLSAGEIRHGIKKILSVATVYEIEMIHKCAMILFVCEKKREI